MKLILIAALLLIFALYHFSGTQLAIDTQYAGYAISDGWGLFVEVMGR